MRIGLEGPSPAYCVCNAAAIHHGGNWQAKPLPVAHNLLHCQRPRFGQAIGACHMPTRALQSVSVALRRLKAEYGKSAAPLAMRNPDLRFHRSSLLPYVAAARGQFAAVLALRLTLSRKARGIGLGGAAIERRAPVASYAGAMALSGNVSVIIMPQASNRTRQPCLARWRIVPRWRAQGVIGGETITACPAENCGAVMAAPFPAAIAQADLTKSRVRP